MEYSFWLDQKQDQDEDIKWKNMINHSSQCLKSCYPISTIKRDLKDFPAEEDEKAKQEWLYKYAITHKITRN